MPNFSMQHWYLTITNFNCILISFVLFLLIYVLPGLNSNPVMLIHLFSRFCVRHLIDFRRLDGKCKLSRKLDLISSSLSDVSSQWQALYLDWRTYYVLMKYVNRNYLTVSNNIIYLGIWLLYIYRLNFAQNTWKIFFSCSLEIHQYYCLKWLER